MFVTKQFSGDVFMKKTFKSLILYFINDLFGVYFCFRYTPSKKYWGLRKKMEPKLLILLFNDSYECVYFEFHLTCKKI